MVTVKIFLKNLKNTQFKSLIGVLKDEFYDSSGNLLFLDIYHGPMLSYWFRYVPKQDEGEMYYMKSIDVNNLVFHSGDKTFEPTEFFEKIKKYIPELSRVGRDNFLCVFEYGDGTFDVTGYRTDTTINVTNNTSVLRTQATNGRWAVYQVMPEV